MNSLLNMLSDVFVCTVITNTFRMRTFLSNEEHLYNSYRFSSSSRPSTVRANTVLNKAVIITPWISHAFCLTYLKYRIKELLRVRQNGCIIVKVYAPQGNIVKNVYTFLNTSLLSVHRLESSYTSSRQQLHLC